MKVGTSNCQDPHSSKPESDWSGEDKWENCPSKGPPFEVDSFQIIPWISISLIGHMWSLLFKKFNLEANNLG